jgi:hypothetical protein
VLLRKYYRIGAREAYCELPEWEVELLLSALPERQEMLDASSDDADDVPEDPWSKPPPDLEDLLKSDQ